MLAMLSANDMHASEAAFHERMANGSYARTVITASPLSRYLNTLSVMRPRAVLKSFHLNQRENVRTSARCDQRSQHTTLLAFRTLVGYRHCRNRSNNPRQDGSKVAPAVLKLSVLAGIDFSRRIKSHGSHLRK